MIKNTYDFGEKELKESNQVKTSLKFNIKDYESSIRDAYAFYLSKIILKNKKFVLIDADLGTVAKTLDFKKTLGSRYIQIGIAEQNGIGVAAGVAQFGKIPIFQSLSVFLTGRPYDQIRESICYSKLNVKLVGLHAGMTLSPDGATHQTGEDIALMSSLPNMQIYAPSDSHQLKLMLPKFLNTKNPSYLRLFFPAAKLISKSKKFTINKLQIIRPLKKYNILSYGYMLQKCDEVIERLKSYNINLGLINCHTIKPFDNKNFIKISKLSKIIFVVEDHNSYGGVGSLITQIVSSKYPKKIISINTKDKFGTTGLPDENLDYLGLSTKKIMKEILKHVFKK
tara:strand:+ start:150 stop:1166 length:1017 start_codon:yes stop_codon:yes gene_type:complete